LVVYYSYNIRVKGNTNENWESNYYSR